MKQRSESPLTPLRANPRLILCLLGLALLVIAHPLPARAEVSVQDDRGRTVQLDQPARRVIALYGALNEIVAALGREDVLAARTEADQFPPAILDRPVIGTHMRPNIELIVGLHPDLVIQLAGRRESEEALAALERLGLKTALFRTSSFSELFSVVRRVGVLVGAEDAATALVTSTEKRLDEVARAVADEPRPGVVFEVRYPNLLAVGGGSMVSDVIDRAGGRNCLGGPEKFVRLNEEELLRLDPEVYLIQQGPMNPRPMPLAERPHFATLKALRSGRVHIVDESMYSRPGPRSIEAVEELAALLHPAAIKNKEKR